MNEEFLQYLQTVEVEKREVLESQLKENVVAETLQVFKNISQTRKAKNLETYLPVRKVLWTENISKVPKESFILTEKREVPNIVSEHWEKIGTEAIREGKLAVLILGGGQGTRLGFEGPKGNYILDFGSKKISIFEIHLRQLQKLKEKYDIEHLDLFVMTSPVNDAETKAHFETLPDCGINVTFFGQTLIPSLDLEGHVMLATPHELSMNPNGNGGVLDAIRNSGLLDKFKKTGVTYIHFSSVDNVLSKLADPIFFGYVLHTMADIGNKCVEKIDPSENIGVMAQATSSNGKVYPCVLEYSELPKELSEARDSDGSLSFNAGNMCSHIFSLEFIERILDDDAAKFYQVHLALKKIKHFCYKTRSFQRPEKPNGYKLEYLIFDVFPETKKLSVLVVPRNEEFSPVKNKEGVDSPETAIKDLKEKMFF